MKNKPAAAKLVSGIDPSPGLSQDTNLSCQMLRKIKKSIKTVKTILQALLSEVPNTVHGRQQIEGVFPNEERGFKYYSSVSASTPTNGMCFYHFIALSFVSAIYSFVN